MSDAAVRELVARLGEDAAFAEAIARAATVEDAVQVAREGGIEITVEELAALSGGDADPLSESDLEVAGGNENLYTAGCLTSKCRMTTGYIC